MKEKKICSFCGKIINNNENIITGIDENIIICSNCLNKGVIINQNNVDENIDNVFTPKQIKENLDKFVIGQEEAKKVLSVEVYNHYKRILSNDKSIEKTNILLMGDSGCGKTYLIQNLAKFINVPLYITDATQYTENGYKGKDVEDIINGLLREADYDIAKAQNGIVYIDEVDKLALKNNYSEKDVGGEGVQKTLLKLIEGCELPLQKNFTIDTSKILFIFGGAFEGLNKENKRKKRQIGFIREEEKESDKFEVTTQDLIKYGFMKEFVGRIPLITQLKRLTKEDLKNILISTNNPIISQYTKLLMLDGIDLKFTDEAINYIVEEAYNKKIGARGLKSILSKSMNELMYELPNSDKKVFTVTKEYLESKK